MFLDLCYLNVCHDVRGARARATRTLPKIHRKNGISAPETPIPSKFRSADMHVMFNRFEEKSSKTHIFQPRKFQAK